MESKRTVHSYKVLDNVYKKAMKVCKRRKQSLSNIIESVVTNISEDSAIVAHRPESVDNEHFTFVDNISEIVERKTVKK